MSIEYRVIGRNIRAARKLKNMTQEAVAEAIDMSPQHFGKVERGDRKINLQRLGQISELLNTPIETLVAGSVITENPASMSAESLPQGGTFLEDMETISKGCSDRALRLMLRLCRDIAEEDKTGDSY